MALTDSEVARLRAELGYSVLTIGAEPRIDHVAIFEQVIQPYTQAGASTTSATAVTAASAPTPVALTLASATGFAAGVRVVIDVDTRQEVVTVQSIAGAVITVQLSLTHSGTYSVSVEGGETMVRQVLRRLEAVSTQIDQAASTAGIKKVDEIEFFAAETSQSKELNRLQMSHRDELAALLGIPNMWRRRSGAGLTTSLY